MVTVSEEYTSSIFKTEVTRWKALCSTQTLANRPQLHVPDDHSGNSIYCIKDDCAMKIYPDFCTDLVTIMNLHFPLRSYLEHLINI
jgi:hypothetical protein